MLADRMFTTFRTAAQGLEVQREKIAVAGRNIAHANTSSRPGNEGVYRPQTVVTSLGEAQDFQRMLLDNVQLASKPSQTGERQDRLEGIGHLRSDFPIRIPRVFSVPALFTHNMGPRMQVVETACHPLMKFGPNHPDVPDENGMGSGTPT